MTRRKDPVTEEVRWAVLERDLGCVAPRLDAEAGPCSPVLTLDIEKMLKTSQFTTDPATYHRRIERLRDEYVRASDDLAMAYHERRTRGR